MNNELGWVEQICEDWPGPIAHAYRALKDMFPHTIAAAQKPDYTVVGALWRLKDVAELLVKVPAIVMLRDAERLGVDVTSIKGKLLDSLSQPGFGHWHRSADNLAQKILHTPDAWTASLASLFRTERSVLTDFGRLFINDNGLVNWRNRELGHGALRTDLDVLAKELAERVLDLNRQLAALATKRPWSDLSLRINGSPDLLIGYESIQRHHDHSPGSHADIAEPVVCEFHTPSNRLELAPYLAARVCRTCEKKDIFFFNGRSTARQVHYLDYLMGHSLLESHANDSRWVRELASMKGIEVRGAVGDRTIDKVVTDLLDSTDFEKEYVPPTYIADEVRRYLDCHDRGIIWLTAPANTGKTVFARNAGKLLEGNPGNVFVAAFQVKREYRFGLEAFSNFVKATFYAGITLNHQLPWDRAEHVPLSRCFVTEASALLEQARELSVAYERVLLVIDGLDELPEPALLNTQNARGGIADLIPRADSLPAGMFVMLTTRPTANEETPPWVTHKIRKAIRGQKNYTVVGIDGRTPGYRRLLRQVFDKSLVQHPQRSRRPKDSDALFKNICDRANWTFLYFNHLVRLLHDGTISEDAVTHMEERGDKLFLAYLRRLESTLGEHEFDRVRELLLVLAACEEAHAQAARIVPSVFFEIDWRGVALDELTGLLHELWHGDSGSASHKRTGVPWRVVFLLRSVRDILRSHRGDATYSRYRLGLKGLLGAMRDDHTEGGWAERLDSTHQRLVKEAIRLDKEDDGEDPGAHETYLLQRGWLHARALMDHGGPKSVERVTQILESFNLPESELLDVASYSTDQWDDADACEVLSIAIDHLQWRFDARQPGPAPSEVATLAAAYGNRAGLRIEHYDHDGAIEDCELAITLIDGLTGACKGRLPFHARGALAITLINRAIACCTTADYTTAYESYGSAIRILQNLRKSAESEGKWEISMHLATAYSNRGTLRCQQDNYSGADADFDHAIDIQKTLRSQRGFRWDQELCSDLARAYIGRSEARSGMDDIAGTRRDLGQAIALLERCLERAGDDWSNDAWLCLARAYSGRANLGKRSGGLANALKDATMAIMMFNSLVTDSASGRKPDVVAELASAYHLRGKLHAHNRHPRRAIADYGRAISVYDGLRKDLGRRCSLAISQDFAEVYMLRGESRTETRDAQGAIVDFSEAISLLEEINGVSHELEPIDIRLQLAESYAHRASLRSKAGDRVGATSDREQASRLSE